MLRTAAPTSDFTNIHASISDALKADSRVHDFVRPELQQEWSRCEPWFPRARNSTPDDLLSGNDVFGGVLFSRPFVFRVVEAEANQPAFRGISEVPTDTYWVAWDGVTCVVLWEQGVGGRIPRAAGRVVADVIGDASARAGFDVYLQACSPACHNIFTHTDVRLTAADSPHRGTHEREAVFHLNSRRPAIEEAQRFHDKISQTFYMFSRMKNLARRIRDLEDLSRLNTEALAKSRLQRERVRWLPPRERLPAAWRLRSWRKGHARALANLWVAVSEIEMHKRLWDEFRRRFHDRAEREKLDVLFPLDYSDDEIAVESLDLALIHAALSDAGTRLDNRRLTIATALTALAAVGGAVLGGVVAGGGV